MGISNMFHEWYTDSRPILWLATPKTKSLICRPANWPAPGGSDPHLNLKPS